MLCIAIAIMTLRYTTALWIGVSQIISPAACYAARLESQMKKLVN